MEPSRIDDERSLDPQTSRAGRDLPLDTRRETARHRPVPPRADPETTPCRPEGVAAAAGGLSSVSPVELKGRSAALVEGRRYAQALPFLQSLIEILPDYWETWYDLGQCYRKLGDPVRAIPPLKHAARLGGHVPQVFLALGFAYVSAGRWEEAARVLRQAIELNPDPESAHSALALAQKKLGHLSEALSSYDAGAAALVRRLAKSMQNSPDNAIFTPEPLGSNLWFGYALQAARYLVASDAGPAEIALPADAPFSPAVRAETHAGCYWTDVRNEAGHLVRVFLPNYFCTLREWLKLDSAYSGLIANRGAVLAMLDREEEAVEHFTEARQFRPPV
jgi:tetratricopeptide (TPR) repeat protein